VKLSIRAMMVKLVAVMNRPPGVVSAIGPSMTLVGTRAVI
jgi:hypothetical protein